MTKNRLKGHGATPVTGGDRAASGKGLVNFREDAVPLLFLLLLPMLCMAGVLFSHTHVIGNQFADGRGQFFYTRLFGFADLATGGVPLWNPRIFAGTPFVGTLQSAVFYPFNLIFALLPIVPAMNWSVTFHLMLSGCFTYYLLKQYGALPLGRVVAAMVYTFSAPQLLHIYAGHLNALCAMVWTPLMFLLCDIMLRKGSRVCSALLGVTIGIQLLAGQPQYLFYTMIALTLYLLFHIVCIPSDVPNPPRLHVLVLLFAAAVAIGVAISAVQILPTLEMTRFSTRENLTFEWVSQFSFPPGNLITYLIPDFYGDMVNFPYWGKNYLWEMSAYVGIIPLFLVVISVLRAERPLVWFFFWLSMVALLSAFGKFTPLLKIAYSCIPGFNLFRGSSKFIFLTAFSLAVLSGFGADTLLARGKNRGIRNSILITSAVALAFVLLLQILLDPQWFSHAITDVMNSGDFYNAPQSFLTATFVQGATTFFRKRAVLAMGLIILSTLVLLLPQVRWIGPRRIMVLLVVLIAGDLFCFGSRYMESFDSREVYGDRGTLAFLQSIREPYRVIVPGAEANFGMANGVETIGGYDTIMVKRTSEFLNLARSRATEVPDLDITISSVNRLTDLLNGKYLLVAAKDVLAGGEKFRKVFDNGTARVYENAGAFPRAFIVHGARRLTGRQAIFEGLTRPDFDPWLTALVEEGTEGLPEVASVRGKLPVVVSHTAGEMKIDAELDRPGLLVVGDAWYPGWHAFVDGRETKIYPANYMMRSLFLPAGRHHVEFRYAPLSFRIGAGITLTMVVLLALFLISACRGASGTRISG